MTTMQTVPYVSNTPLVSAEAFTRVDNHTHALKAVYGAPSLYHDFSQFN